MNDITVGGFDIPKDYKVRPGTIDHGKEYEFKVAALLCVRCLGTDTKQMWLAMNPEGCGAFDDVILCRKSDDGVAITYFIQLKHKEKEDELKPNALRATKGDFSLNKYIADIQILIPSKSKQAREKILDYLQNPNQIFVLFTNKDTEDESYLQNVDDPKLDFINIGGKCYKIIYSKIGRVLSKSEEELTKHLFLFTKQMNVININEAIEDGLLAIFPNVNLPRKVLAEKFIFYVTEWSKGHLGGHYPLDKTLVLKKILELIFEEYLFKVNYSEIVDSAQQARVWHDVAKKTPVMVIEKDDLVTQFIKTYIGGIVLRRNEEIKKLCSSDLNVAQKNLMRDVGSMISYSDVYEYLWKNEGVPLVLQINNLENLQNILNILELVPDIFRVIILIGSDVKLPVLVKKYLSTTLADISKKQQVSILLRPIKLQGRALKLQDAITDQYLHLVTMKDIIHILLGEFNIGGEVNSLPEFFVDRSIPKICLNIDVLEKVTHEKFVIQCKSIADFQNFMTSQKLSLDTAICYYDEVKPTLGCRIFITEHQDNFVQIPEAIVHYLILHHSNHLEWVKSVGGIDNIQEFKIKTKIPLKPNNVKEMLKDVSSFPKLISSGPGMGKTVLLDYIALNAPVNLWLLVINLSKHCEYYNRDDFADLGPLEYLQYFHANILCKQNVTKSIFQRHLENKTLFLLFDGYDEVPASFQAQVTQMIKSLHESDYNLCVTTRPGMKNDLEQMLSTFAVDLNPFSRNEQIAFLLHSFGVNFSHSNSSLIELFVEKLLNAAERNFDAFDKNFMGVPLQTKLLGEVFSQDCKIFVDTNQFNCERFNLLFLYRSFIKQKIRVVCEKYGAFNKDVYTDYKNYRSLLALQLLFDKSDLIELEIDNLLECTLKVMPNALQKLQKDGIVMAESNSNVTFTHRSFAEYLVAEWLAQNINSNHKSVVQQLVQKLFDLNYTIVRNMFDRIFADGYELHSAIIIGNTNLVKNLIQIDLGKLNEVDKGGRTFLHLMAAWGTRHPTAPSKHLTKLLGESINAQEDSLNMILKLEIPNNKLNSHKDYILGHTPLDYALIRNSLDIADTISSKLEDVNGCISITMRGVDKELIYFYINELNYDSLESVLVKQILGEELDDVINLHEQTVGDGADFNSDNYSALHIAAIFGHCAKINSLLSLSPIDKKDCAGRTALHWAVARTYIDIITLLIQNGANLNISDNTGLSPLHYAVIVPKKCPQNILKYLLNSGADPNYQDPNGRTALHYAVHYNQKDSARLLLNFRKNVDSATIMDNKGKTALELAAEKSNKNMFGLCLSQGTKTNVTTIDIFKVTCNLFQNKKKRLTEHIPTLKFVEKITQLHMRNLDTAFELIPTKTLHIACTEGRSTLVSKLLSEGHCIEARDIENRTPLHCAALAGHHSIVSQLISKGADLEAKDQGLYTSLHYAATTGHLQVVSELLTYGANTERNGPENRTALHFACEAGQLEVVSKLLLKGANFEACDDRNCTPLYLAAEKGHLIVVAALESHGANLNATSNKKWTALHVAAYEGHLSVVSYLLSKGANLEAQTHVSCTPLHLATKKGHLDVISALISKGAVLDAVSEHNNTALHLAAIIGHASVVAELMARGANVSAKDSVKRTALHNAAKFGYIEIVSELISKGACLEAKDDQERTALHYAAEMGYVDVVAKLLLNGAILNAKDENDRTALHLAAHKGQICVVSELISQGADLEETNCNGGTALHDAVIMGHTQIVSELLSRSANIEAKDNTQYTALHLAALSGHESIVTELLSNGADLEAQARERITPLHIASMSGQLRIVSQLISKGANINVKDDKDRTALQFAAYSGQMGVVSELLAKGANLSTKDEEGLTALHLASITGLTSIVLELLSKGAQLEAKDNSGKTALHWSAFHARLSVLSALLGKGANLEATTSRRSTALHLAAGKGHTTAVAALLANGANLEARDGENHTALHLATITGQTKVVAQLVSNGANLEAEDNKKLTALHFATCNGRMDIASVLLSNGANLEAKDVNSCTALHLAVENGKLDVVSNLLVNGADIDAKANECTALHLASLLGFANLVAELVSKGANLETETENNYTSLHLASIVGHVDVVSELASKGANLEAKTDLSHTALHLASICGNMYVVRALLLKGANLETKSNDEYTALHLASTAGHLNVVRELLYKGANVSAKTTTNCVPLHFAAAMGHLEIVTELFTQGADIEATDSQNCTATHYAAAAGRLGVVRLLLHRGSVVDARDDNGCTALHFAALSGDLGVVHEILDKEFDVNAKDNQNCTPLHFAACQGHVSIVSKLLAKGSDVEAKDVDGRTALHFAAAAGHLSVINLVLDTGADVEAKDRDGYAVLHVAVEYGRLDVVGLLLQRGANIQVTNRRNYTALHVASAFENSVTLALLLRSGCVVGARGFNGCTSLHMAATSGAVNNARLLLSYGADVNAQDDKGETAVNYAVQKGDSDMVSLLLSKGAEVQENSIVVVNEP